MKALLSVLTLLLIPAMATNATIPDETDPSQKPERRHITLYEKRDAYCAWPAIARAKNGDIVVMFTRTEEHLGPNGEILLSRSTDNGESWIPPAIAYDTPLDDRESGITRLNNGDLLAHFRSVQWKPDNYLGLPENAYETSLLGRWMYYVQQPAYLDAGRLDGAWHAVSSDSGYTWSAPVPGRDSIHGGLQLADGSMLVASYRDDGGHIGVYAADSSLGTYSEIATVTCPRRDTIRFGEPHILQMESGRILMMIRATAIPYDDESPLCNLWGTYSDDGGKTWAEPYETPLWGFPPHLLQLEDGRILCSYGHRRPPYGQRAAISTDGITWKKADEFIIRDDAPNKDLGYPVSIELEPGRILTVYYQPNVPPGSTQRMTPPDPLRVKPGILGTIWELPR